MKKDSKDAKDPDALYQTKLSRMSEIQLISEWDIQNQKAIRTKDKPNWFIAERKEVYSRLELLRRGYFQKTVWVRLANKAP